MQDHNVLNARQLATLIIHPVFTNYVLLPSMHYKLTEYVIIYL